MPRAKKKSAKSNGKPKKLNARQEKWVEHFMTSGNASDASRKAGYKSRANNQGNRMLANVDIQAALAKRQESDPTIMNREQRQQFWTKVACDPDVSTQNRLKASELLGKSGADFIERRYNENKDVTDYESLNDIIGRRVARDKVEEVDGLPN